MTAALNFEFDVRIPDALIQQMMDGEITCSMLVTVAVLRKWADWSTGHVRFCSAGGLVTATHGAYSERTFQDCLKKLEDMGWITRHMTPGSRKNYPVTLNNYKWVGVCGDERCCGGGEPAGKVHILNPKAITLSDPFKTGACGEASGETSDEGSDEGSDITNLKRISKRISKRERERDLTSALKSRPPQPANPKSSLSPDPSGPAAGSKPSTGISVNEAVNRIIKTAQMQNSAAAFDGGSNKKLGAALKQLGHTTYVELDTVVGNTLAGCDEFMLRNFGSRLAAQLVGAVQALRVRKEIRNEKHEAARPMEEWRDSLTDVAMHSDANLDEWLKENPVPGDNPSWGEYHLSEAKKDRTNMIAWRDRWREAWQKHLREDEDCGWAWWVGQINRDSRDFSFDLRREEDTVTADFDKEKARRAGEKASASARSEK